MTVKEFKETIKEKTPPLDNKIITALWYHAKGEWDKAHTIVQMLSDHNAEWVHAFLHREEGDFSNASYWYRMAGKSMPDIPLQDEWDSISESLLKLYST